MILNIILHVILSRFFWVFIILYEFYRGSRTLIVKKITAHNDEIIWAVGATLVWLKAQGLEDWHRISKSTKLTDEAFLLFKDMLKRDIYKYKASFQN